MEKIKINKHKYKFLEENLHIYKKQKIINDTQYNQIQNLYTIKNTNPIQIFTMLGAILIGLGIVVYIGSNWKNLDSIFKLLILITAYLSSNIVSLKIKSNYPKTSKAFLYLGILIYGAGLMLTQGMFKYYISFMPSGILFILGILPTAYVFKEEKLYIFTCILTLIFSFMYIRTNPYELFIAYSLVYIVGRYKFKDTILAILARDIVLYSLIPQYLYKYNIDELYINFIMLTIGVFIRYFKFKKYKFIYEIQGLALIAICAMNLTFSHVWSNNQSQLFDIITYIIASIYFIYFIYEAINKHLIFITPVIILIIRYLSDSLLLNISKSIVFIIVGLILLVLGFYIEKSIHKKGSDNDER